VGLQSLRRVERQQGRRGGEQFPGGSRDERPLGRVAPQLGARGGVDHHAREPARHVGGGLVEGRAQPSGRGDRGAGGQGPEHGVRDGGQRRGRRRHQTQPLHDRRAGECDRPACGATDRERDEHGDGTPRSATG
jgi:hypothetical protein